MAAKSDSSLLPNLVLWKTADELWARQSLKLAAENWLDERVNAVMGLNGKWEFQKLKGSAIDLDRITIVTRVMPIDPSQQDSMSQAVASGALDPQDPRVKRKMMELFHLPVELDDLYMDQKKQWKEIEQMSNGQQVQPQMIRDNDQVHISICRDFLNSDEADENPQLAQMVLQHAQMHIINMARQQAMAAAVQASGQQAMQQAGGGPPPGQPQGGPQEQGGKQPEGQKQEHGGQVPRNPVKRQQRAEKGAMAKPHRPQPSSGNGSHVQRLT